MPSHDKANALVVVDVAAFVVAPSVAPVVFASAVIVDVVALVVVQSATP